MARQSGMPVGQARPDLPHNELGLPLEGFGQVISPSVVRGLAQAHTHSVEQAEQVLDHAVVLAELVDRLGPTKAARAFLDCPQPLRRDRAASAVTVAVLERRDIAARDAHPLPGRTARRLSPLEAATLRVVVRSSPQRAFNVALCEQGAVVGQHVEVQPDDPYRDDDGLVVVPLAAARGVVARTVTLAPWATDAAWQAVEAARRDGHPPTLCDDGGDRARRRRNVAASVDRALAVAGLDATVAAIRLTAGHDAAERGGLHAAMHALGVTRSSIAERLLASSG